jgi:hypothetical protein
MIARDEHWWGVQNKTGCGRGDYFEADLTVGHRLLPLQAGALPSPQPPTPGAWPLPVMLAKVVLIDPDYKVKGY